jgi:hypothetical protein
MGEVVQPACADEVNNEVGPGIPEPTAFYERVLAARLRRTAQRFPAVLRHVRLLGSNVHGFTKIFLLGGA